jgi:hypothetical protein
MELIKKGQIVKFKEPVSIAESKIRFLVKEIFYDVENPRAIVKVIDNSYLSSTHIYLVSDLEAEEEIFQLHEIY